MIYYYGESLEDKTIAYSPLDKVLTDIVSNDVYAMENVDGYLFKIVCKEKIVFNFDKKLPESIASEYFKIFTSKYVGKVKALRKEFADLNMVIFAKGTKNSKYFDYGEKDIIFTDIFINSNWILQDDIIEYFEKYKLRTPKILYEGLYSNDAMKDLAENYKSEFSKKEIPFGFYIKTKYEDGLTSAGSRKIYLFDSEGKLLLEEKEKERVEEIAKELFDNHFMPSSEKWKSYVQFKIDEWNKATMDWDKKRIIEKTIDLILNAIYITIENEAVKNIVDSNELEKMTRKKIGEYVVKNFFLKRW